MSPGKTSLIPVQNRYPPDDRSPRNPSTAQSSPLVSPPAPLPTVLSVTTPRSHFDKCDSERSGRVPARTGRYAICETDYTTNWTQRIALRGMRGRAEYCAFSGIGFGNRRRFRGGSDQLDLIGGRSARRVGVLAGLFLRYHRRNGKHRKRRQQRAKVGLLHR